MFKVLKKFWFKLYVKKHYTEDEYKYLKDNHTGKICCVKVIHIPNDYINELSLGRRNENDSDPWEDISGGWVFYDYNDLNNFRNNYTEVSKAEYTEYVRNHISDMCKYYNSIKDKKYALIGNIPCKVEVWVSYYRDIDIKFFSLENKTKKYTIKKFNREYVLNEMKNDCVKFITEEEYNSSIETFKKIRDYELSELLVKFDAEPIGSVRVDKKSMRAIPDEGEIGKPSSYSNLVIKKKAKLQRKYIVNDVVKIPMVEIAEIFADKNEQKRTMTFEQYIYEYERCENVFNYIDPKL